ncbi:MAG TPA: hypothetical protein VNM43_03280 [Dehalococcoidia bacterium]|nr:hypothetical protein [Dehalococcoidia bacterium]
MGTRHVVVLFQHRLFGEAIARLLREDGRLCVTTLEIDGQSAPKLRELRPDAIVVEEGPLAHAFKASLVDIAPTLTVVVDPEENLAEVYERHEVIRATVEELIARLVGEGPRDDVARVVPPPPA